MPSTLVGLVDGLESRGLLKRHRSAADRRNYALKLTGAGTAMLERIRECANDHEADLTSALTPDEHLRLSALLSRIADQQGLTPGVHPGYRKLPGAAVR